MKNYFTLYSKIGSIVSIALFFVSSLMNAQTFNYGTGDITSNTAPFNASGGTNIVVSGNSITVTGNVNMTAGTYNFENFTINAGATVTVTGTAAPLIIRCTDTFTNNGTLSANGGNGGNGSTSAVGSGGAGVAGGANGGSGGNLVAGTNGNSFGTSTGRGTGGATGTTRSSGGGGGSYGIVGTAGFNASGTQGGTGAGVAGTVYGNAQLTLQVGAGAGFYSAGQTTAGDIWLLGGSGGGGGGSRTGGLSQPRGGGGGAGGGAIQVTANTITIGSQATAISVIGGNGGTSVNAWGASGGAGGGGAGGSINLQSFNYSNATGNSNLIILGGTGGVGFGTGSHAGRGGNGGAGRLLIQEDVILCNQPTTQASNFSIITYTPNTATIQFTRGDGDKVLVVCRQGSNPSPDPTSGTGNYTADLDFTGNGSVLGGGKVVYDGTGDGANEIFELTVSGLTYLSSYYFAIYEYIEDDFCYKSPGYKPGIAVIPDCTPPTVQTSNMSFENVISSQLQLNVTRGNGDGGVLVLARLNADVNAVPVSGNTYTHNTAYGQGDEIGSGNFVVYNGTGNGAGNEFSFDVTGLTPTQTYYFKAFDYNSTDICYNIVSPAGSSQLIPACNPPIPQASDIAVNSITHSSAEISWTRGGGDSVLVVASHLASVNFVPENSVVYTANSGYGSGQAAGNGYIIYKGTGTSVNATQLYAGATMHIAVFEFDNPGETATCYNGNPANTSFQTNTACFRTVASGNWNNSAIWEIQPLCSGNWEVSTSVPDFNAGTILIRDGHDVIISANVTIDEVIVESTASLSVANGVTATVNNGAGTDLNVSGTLTQTGTFVFNSGVSTIFNEGATYIHNRDGGALPTATWADNTNCNITGMIGAVPTNLSQNFYNFLWNNEDQASVGGFDDSNFPTQVRGTAEFRKAGAGSQVNFNCYRTWSGDLIVGIRALVTLSSTGAGTFQVRDLTLTGNSANSRLLLNNSTHNLILNCRNLTINNGGIMDYNGLNTNPSTVNVSGNLTINNGNIIVSSSAAGSATVNFNGSTEQKVNITAPVSIYGQSNRTIAFNTLSGSIVNFETPFITGGGSFVAFNVNAGSTIMIPSQQGITIVGNATGSIQAPTTRTYNAGANYMYTGTTGQVTGNGLPASSSGTITVNLSDAGILNLTQATTINGNLSLTNGSLQLNAINLTVATTGNITGTFNGTNKINTNSTGQLMMAIPTAGLPVTKLFPIGETTNYSPASLTFDANSAALTVGARVIPQLHPSIGLAEEDNLLRYWSFTTIGSGAYSYKPALTFINEDVNGDVEAIRPNRYNSGEFPEWSVYAGGAESNVVTWTDFVLSTVAPLHNSDYTGKADACLVPEQQPGAVSLGDGTFNTQEMNWASTGGGTGGVIVLVKEGSPITIGPLHGTVYNANTVFGLGDQILTTGAFVVYKGTGLTTTITGLEPLKTYYYQIYAFNDTENPCYLIPTDVSGNFTTGSCHPSNQPTSFVSSCGTQTELTLQFVRGNGDRVIVLARAASAVNADPVYNTSYTANSVFGSGSQIGAGNFVVYDGDASGIVSFEVTGLTSGVTYHFRAHEYNTSPNCYNYNAPLTLSQATRSAGTYTSSTTTQNTATVFQNTLAQHVIGLSIVVGGGTDPATVLNSITFNTNGSTNVATDVINARIFYTGTSSTFSSATQFGTTFTSLSGNLTATDNFALLPGTNYFWIAYDLNVTATVGNVLDATIVSFNLTDFFGTSDRTPSITAPAGSRSIVAPGPSGYCIPSPASNSVGDYISAPTWSGGNLAAPHTYGGGNNTGSGVTNKTNQPAPTLTPGVTYTLSYYADDFIGNTNSVWIDWDQSGTWASSGVELVRNSGGSFSVNQSVTVPLGATPGATRMRIINRFPSAGTNACVTSNGSSTSGVYVDYTVIVAGGGGSEQAVSCGTLAPTVTTPVTYFLNDPAVPLTATGTGLLWYTAAIGGAGSATAPTPSTSATGTTAYYVSQTDECQGPRTQISVVVDVVCCIAPTEQVSNVAVSNITNSSAVLNWTNGNGGRTILLIKQGSPVNSDPMQNTAYTANSNYNYGSPSGSQIGSGNYVMYGNTGTNVNITGLHPSTTYYYAAYTFFEESNCYMLPGVTGMFSTPNGPMTYISSTNLQQTGNSTLGSTNQPILRLEVHTGPGTDPSLSLTGITFNTTGTTNVADLAGARIFYTGSNGNFDATTAFGNSITNPSGSQNISGSQTLVPGVNYFWLVYDVSIGATVGNLMDAQITSVDVGGQQTPTVTNPVGHRTITSLMSLSCGYTYSNVAATWVSNVGQSGTSVVASGAASIDDQRWPNQNFAEDFTFEFNGNVYNSFGIHSKGFIWFGSTTPPGMFWTPISSASGYEGAIAAWAFDMVAHSNSTTTPQVTVRYTGTAPNRVCIIEWTAFRPYGNTGGLCGTYGYPTDWNRYDIQLQLHENGGSFSNRIDIVLRDQETFCINGNGATAQVGLRGANNSDFLNRTGGSGNTVHQTNSPGTLNNQTLNHSTSNYFNGTRILRFTPTFDKPVLSPSVSASNTCPDLTVDLSTTSPVGAKQWYFNNLSVSGANSSNLTADASGTYVVVVTQGGCSKVSEPVEVTIISCVDGCATLVSPLNTQTGISIDAILNWEASEGATFYNVYFGNVNPPPQVPGTNGTTYTPLIENYNATYYWRIEPIVDGSPVTGCNVWSFTTKALACPVLETPANNASNVAQTQMLYWEALPGNVWYSVYFGTSNPPPLVAENLYTNTYDPGLLNVNQTYYWKVVPHTPNSSVADCGVFSFSTIVESSILDLTWTGTVSNEWNNANNWEPNFVPTSTNNVLIPSTYNIAPVVNMSKTEPARASNMTISSGATLTIDPNRALTVHGNLTNNGIVHIRSAQNPQASIHFTHDGSLIILGNRTGSGTYSVDRYFSGSFWHMISNPISTAQASIFTNLWIRGYNESTNTWGSFITSPTAPLAVGKGYSVWSFNTSETRTFNGTINHGTLSIPMQYTNNPNLGAHQKGWNLVGNPYPSAINWNQAGGWTKTNIGGTIYLYSAGTGNYMTWNGMFGLAGPMIAMGQGFFVQSSAVNPVLTINPSAQIHHDVTFRNEEANIIQLNVAGNNYADYHLIAVRADASDEFDYSYDAVKLPGMEEAPQLHSMKQDARLAVNTIQSEDDIIGKVVHLQVGAATNYKLTYTHSLISDNIVLLDRFAGKVIYAGEAYEFIASPSDRTDRFEFIDESSIMGIANGSIQFVIPIWEHNNVLYIGNLGVETLKTISIYNMLGAKVLSSTSHITDLNTLSSGVYTVKVYTNKQIVNKKIIVK